LNEQFSESVFFPVGHSRPSKLCRATNDDNARYEICESSWRSFVQSSLTQNQMRLVYSQTKYTWQAGRLAVFVGKSIMECCMWVYAKCSKASAAICFNGRVVEP
jgi:hypothetical protein